MAPIILLNGLNENSCLCTHVTPEEGTCSRVCATVTLSWRQLQALGSLTIRLVCQLTYSAAAIAWPQTLFPSFSPETKASMMPWDDTEYMTASV